MWLHQLSAITEDAAVLGYTEVVALGDASDAGGDSANAGTDPEILQGRACGAHTNTMCFGCIEPFLEECIPAMDWSSIPPGNPWLKSDFLPNPLKATNHLGKPDQSYAPSSTS